MRILSIVLIVVIGIVCGHQMAFADRLHRWVDSKGVTHLSKEPPPVDGKLIEIMEYSVRSNKPAKSDEKKLGGTSEEVNRNQEVNPLQETKKLPKPKQDLATACYIYADPEEVYVYVIEYTDPDRVLERVLYQGTIAKGQKQLIKSSHGKIEYSYRRSSEDRAYGDNHADCVRGHVVSIP